jgi:hypothetical protein
MRKARKRRGTYGLDYKPGGKRSQPFDTLKENETAPLWAFIRIHSRLLTNRENENE